MDTGPDPMSRAGRPAGSKRGHRTLSAILEAAGNIASLEGLEQLSMRRLASAVGMSKSGLYAHFASKEELQLATIEHFARIFDAHVPRDPPDDPRGGIEALLESWLAFYEGEVFPGGCFLIISAVEFAAHPGPVRDALTAGVDRQIATLETTIRHAKETGALDTELDAEQTAFELHAILMNTHALFQIKRDPAIFNRARAATGRLLGRR